MIKKTLKVNDFIFTIQKINSITRNSVGIIKEISNSKVKVFFVGKAKIVKTGMAHINFLDVEKTGKPYKRKICNICHILKEDMRDFDINQTDSKGRKTTRPSCRKCRKKIEGIKLLIAEKKKLDKIAPKRKTIFSCPICEKRSIVGITANLVRDHDHKTGKARAWICDSCNTGLGRFKDDIRFVKKIIRYLKKYN